ncbi:hypothetical protein [Methanofollis fontis]|uniref:Uncharacterized protein n=1 Tax=Methanofollis fontis TaxID=2052832 RepID=A0A483CNL4_9EURY|nr:hypothetical protein [Methanofollis fontis]TAJ44202.1 hypothetical protein CUJ86_09260 [Methanofollis fontis]
MKNGFKFLIGCVFALCLIGAASASVNYGLAKTPDVNPASGDLSPGQHVTVGLVLDLKESGDLSFPDDHYLEFFSELDAIRWSYNIEVDGIGIFSQPRSSSSRYLYLDGWDLAYKSDSDVSVKVTVEGNAPTVTSTQQKVLVRIHQLDKDDDVVEDSEYILKRTVVNPADVQTNIGTAANRLNALKADIDGKTAMGVDTTEATAKYEEAKAAINSASATSDYAAAQNYLTTANAAMDASETALSRSWAQKEINDAQTAINEIDGIISYFQVNRSMSTDQRVMSLVSQRDIAAQELSGANDKMNAQDYDAARIKAEEADQKANATLNTAKALKEEIGEGFSLNLGSLPIYIGAGILIVLVIGGVLYLRNKRKWDELG